MTRKHHRQRKSPAPLAVIVLGGLLLVGAAFFFAKRDSTTAGGTPAIAVDTQRIDLGFIKLGGYRTFKIKVTNTGDGVLRFKETPYIEVLEGCCPPELTVGSVALAPGESTYVQSPEFMMHEGMDGPHDFAVHLVTNAPRNSDLVVHVISDWGP